MEMTIDTNVRLRRRRYAFVRVADEPTLDIRRFLRGEIAFQSDTQCALLCPVRGTSLPLTAGEFGLMIDVPSDRWLTSAEFIAIEPEWRTRLLALARRGTLVRDPA